ncbi:MAG: hypothetical protein ACXAC2_01160, partial [Candidatus Kariarchaeaceae archaeon]
MLYQSKPGIIQLPPSDQTINNSYTHETILPGSKKQYLFLWVITFMIIFAGALFISQLIFLIVKDRSFDLFKLNIGSIYVSVAFAFTLIFIPWGLITGLIWKFYGKRLSSLLYLKPLRFLINQSDRDDKLISIIRYLTGTEKNKIYMQLETPDLDLSNYRNILKNTFRLILIYLALLVTVLNLFQRLLIRVYDPDNPERYAGIFLLCFAISLMVIALYQPLTWIVGDAKVMTIHENGTIKYVASRVRNFIDGFFGLFGIFSGYSLTKDQLDKYAFPNYS